MVEVGKLAVLAVDSSVVGSLGMGRQYRREVHYDHSTEHLYKMAAADNMELEQPVMMSDLMSLQ